LDQVDVSPTLRELLADVRRPQQRRELQDLRHQVRVLDIRINKRRRNGRPVLHLEEAREYVLQQIQELEAEGIDG